MKIRLKLMFAFVFILAALVIIYFAFFKENAIVKEYILKEVKIVSSTPDTLIKFFVSVSGIYYDESQGKIYVSDNRAGCIAVFDSNMNFLYRIGRKGRGPGEFSYTGCIRKYRNFLYIYDLGKIQILRDDTNYVTSFPVYWFPDVQFAIDLNGNVVIGAPSDKDSLLAVIDTSGKILNTFGKKVKQRTQQETFLKNGVWPVVDEDGNIYVVFLSLPYIRKYSKDLNLLIEKKLKSEVEYGLKRVEEMSKQNPNIRATMVGGVYFRSPYLYVRYASPEPIIHVYDTEKLELKRKLKLKTKRGIAPFIVTKENNVVAFDLTKGELVKYEVE